MQLGLKEQAAMLIGWPRPALSLRFAALKIFPLCRIVKVLILPGNITEIVFHFPLKWRLKSNDSF